MSDIALTIGLPSFNEATVEFRVREYKPKLKPGRTQTECQTFPPSRSCTGVLFLSFYIIQVIFVPNTQKKKKEKKKKVKKTPPYRKFSWP